MNIFLKVKTLILLLLKAILNQLNQDDVNSLIWLKIVWSLVVLNKAQSQHLESVLNQVSAHSILGKLIKFSRILMIALQTELLKLHIFA